jgi:hypothetical protein
MPFKFYIDESGDEGIGTGGTRWFILGAVIVDDSINLQTSEMIVRVREKLGKDPKATIHWTKIRNHDKKLYICQELVSEDWKFACVITDKTHDYVLNSDGLFEKWHLYSYSTRLLLERLSWFARDNGREKAKLVFEKRTNMDYTALKNYLAYLHDWQPPTQVEWDFVDWQNPIILSKEKSRLLQASDIVCGALSDALERSKLGNIEPRYILGLKDRFYRRGNNLFSYGMKFLQVKGDVISQYGAEYDWLAKM